MGPPRHHQAEVARRMGVGRRVAVDVLRRSGELRTPRAQLGKGWADKVMVRKLALGPCVMLKM